jgi:hypothetical protein
MQLVEVSVGVGRSTRCSPSLEELSRDGRTISR